VQRFSCEPLYTSVLLVFFIEFTARTLHTQQAQTVLLLFHCHLFATFLYRTIRNRMCSATFVSLLQRFPREESWCVWFVLRHDSIQKRITHFSICFRVSVAH